MFRTFEFTVIQYQDSQDCHFPIQVPPSVPNGLVFGIVSYHFRVHLNLPMDFPIFSLLLISEQFGTVMNLDNIAQLEVPKTTQTFE